MLKSFFTLYFLCYLAENLVTQVRPDRKKNRLLGKKNGYSSEVNGYLVGKNGYRMDKSVTFFYFTRLARKITQKHNFQKVQPQFSQKVPTQPHFSDFGHHTLNPCHNFWKVNTTTAMQFWGKTTPKYGSPQFYTHH